VCCHSNETRAPIANPPNTVQLEGTPYNPPSYIRVRAVMWECGEGETDGQVHRPWPIYTVFKKLDDQTHGDNFIIS